MDGGAGRRNCRRKSCLRVNVGSGYVVSFLNVVRRADIRYLLAFSCYFAGCFLILHIWRFCLWLFTSCGVGLCVHKMPGSAFGFGF